MLLAWLAEHWFQILVIGDLAFLTYANLNDTPLLGRDLSDILKKLDAIERKLNQTSRNSN